MLAVVALLLLEAARQRLLEMLALAVLAVVALLLLAGQKTARQRLLPANTY